MPKKPDEVVDPNAQNPAVTDPPAAPGVQNPAEPKPDVDENGVPWKNRAKEYERKYNSALDKLAQTPAPSTPAVEEDEFAKSQREITRDELQRERNSDRKLSTILNHLCNDEKKGKYYQKYRQEIEDEIAIHIKNPELRGHEPTVTHIASAVLGRHIDDLTVEQPPIDTTAQNELNKKMVGDPNNVLNSGSGSGSGNSKVILTPAETRFADDKSLWDKGYTNSEVRDFYKKRQDKLKELAKK